MNRKLAVTGLSAIAVLAGAALGAYIMQGVDDGPVPCGDTLGAA